MKVGMSAGRMAVWSGSMMAEMKVGYLAEQMADLLADLLVELLAVILLRKLELQKLYIYR